MIYPQEPLAEWIEKYNLRIIKKDCPECGKEYELNIPIAIKGYRGLQMQEHGCKESVSMFVLSDREEDKKWRDVLFGG